MAVPERKEPDRWGYTRYAVVLFMPEEDRRKVDALRTQLPLPTAMIQAHVTVKGSFDSPEDLEDVRGRMRSIAGKTSLFEMELIELLWRKTGAGFRVDVSREIQALHDALYDAIEPVSRNVYAPEAGDQFRPHMTVCQEMPEEAFEEAKRLAETLDIAHRSRVESMHLMGLVGPRHGGRWEVVEEFPFTG
jgi:2'-5' RNA ligase